jgi:hypothetical protein
MCLDPDEVAGIHGARMLQEVGQLRWPAASAATELDDGERAMSSPVSSVKAVQSWFPACRFG